jgi:hypothetical protein
MFFAITWNVNGELLLRKSISIEPFVQCVQLWRFRNQPPLLTCKYLFIDESDHVMIDGDTILHMKNQSIVISKLSEKRDIMIPGSEFKIVAAMDGRYLVVSRVGLASAYIGFMCDMEGSYFCFNFPQRPDFLRFCEDGRLLCATDSNISLWT